MSSTSSQQFESYLPVYDVVPEKWEDARPFLVETLKKISNAVNDREIGFFLDQELLSGKAFIPGANTNLNTTPSQFRQVLRMVINFGPLPNTSTKSVSHGITVNSNFTLVQMFASATDPTNLQALPIPYESISNDGIGMFMDSTKIYINTQSNRSSFTRTFVIIEYTQEL